MKILFPLLCVLLLAAFSFASIGNDEKTDSDFELNRVFREVSSYAKVKYNLKTIGIGISSPENVLISVGISFRSDHQLSMDESRKILLDLANKMKTGINSSKILVETMQKPPFTLNDVCIEIFFVNKEGDSTTHPDWAVVSFSYGKFKFKTNETDSFEYKLNITENYVAPKE